MLVGYMRVSSKSQDSRNGEARQREALEKYGVEKFFYDVMSGRSMKNRPELKKMLEFLREGDRLVVSELSRLGRNATDVLLILQELEEKGVTLVSLKEGINSSTEVGRFLTVILSAVSELELSYINERAESGREAARSSGRNLGGRPRLDQKKLDEAMELFESSSLTVKEIAAKAGVSVSAIYREANRREIARGSK